MEANSEILDKLEEYIDNYLAEMKEKYRFNKNAIDKLEHIKRTVLLVDRMTYGDRLSIIAAKFHDIGRFKQLELLGNFNDGALLHHNAGTNTILKEVFNNNLEISEELNTIRQVIQYGGRQKFIPYNPSEISEEVNTIIDIISRVDEIENGCMGATGYLVREAQEDVKGYRKNNPNLDMKKVSPEVWEFFIRGEKFDKMKYCKTYADYTLFACVLAIQALKGKDRKIAKATMELKCNGYDSALEGYKDIFSKLVQPEYSEHAYNVLQKFYNRKDDVNETKKDFPCSIDVDGDTGR